MATPSIDEVSVQLEDIYNSIKKAEINYKKCPKERLTLGYVKVRMQYIDEYWSSFKQLHSELLKISTTEQRQSLLYFVENYYDKCEEKYLNLKTTLQDLLDFNTPTPAGTPMNTSSVSGDIKTVMDVKLPRLELPKFSGLYEEWQAFEDIFTSIIHNNQSLSDVQRFYYLKSCLIGEASTTLKHYKVVEKNYRPAWDTLKKRYSHKRLVVNAILKRLFSSKKMLSQSPSLLKTLVDNMKECLHSFKGLSINTDAWDPLLIFLATQKLDPESHKQWEEHVSLQETGDLPTINELFHFLENKIHTLELTSAASSQAKTVKERSFHASATSEKNCLFCQDAHALCHCKQFGKLDPSERSEFAKNQKLCYNCLLPGHSVLFCKLNVSCEVCHRRHHSLLHQSSYRGATPAAEENKTTDVSAHAKMEEVDDGSQNDDERLEDIAANFAADESAGLLATAIVPVRDTTGRVILLRALVDKGSQATFITERAAQLFKVKREYIRGRITGVGDTNTRVNHTVRLDVLSRYENKFNLNVKMYVMPTRVTKVLPSKRVPINEESGDWAHLKDLPLADPTFNKPGRIDLLLGVKVYSRILKEKLIKGPPGKPIAQLTSLGWIIFGEIDESNSQDDVIAMHHQLDLDNMVKNMWELEAPFKRAYTADERLCEEIYETLHSRTEDGRYIVKLPMRNKQPQATQGDTRSIAMKRLKQLESRFDRMPPLKTEYTRVLEEYLAMNHMEEVPEEEIEDPAVYLSHHAIIREEKETTKYRIVFDASAKGSNNKSLNDDLLVGPQLQEDLRNIIMRWRMRKVCYVADVEKMYRQILVTKADTNYQRLLWRNNPKEEVKDYRLLRVTFGTASAPYLAVKMLHQIAMDEGKDQPNAARVIKEDFYMDDLISGNDTVDEAITTAREVKSILQRGGFHLQKWTSNEREFLEQIEASQRSSRVKMDIKLDGTIQALGLSWNVGNDTFQYTLELPDIPEIVTKRNILAQVQRLFDPLGWLAPAILPAKSLLQQLWLQGISWDEEVSADFKQKWINLRQSFDYLCDIEVERWLYTTQSNLQAVSVHGFCDASTKAYGAVTYLRVETEGEIRTGIIAAKTRVAPVKPVSLPKLELCAAVLLSRLLKQVKEAMRIPDTHLYAWTDSSVVLSWLLGDPGRWNVFVCNRVVEILDNIGNQRWYHVASEDNPADIASRGTTLQLLAQDQKWWKGPKWLQTDDIPYRRPEIKETELERKRNIQVNVNIESEEPGIKFEEFDTLSELLKTIVYSLRFLNSKKTPENIQKELTTTELENALIRCVKIVQRREFGAELDNLMKGKDVKRESTIKGLNPYLDEKNVLRVGGRLRNADIPEERKHPIILSSRNALTLLIIADAHQKTLHGTMPLMFVYLRSKYWILRVKNAIKAYIHKCVVCARQRAITRTQIMGDLPKVRITQARPFLHSGVDFAGPIQVLMSRGRGAKSNKAYIAIFVCMVVKCIHLELVGDMTSESFIGAYKRFVARRGRCTHLWSDQGRNFVGADKDLTIAWTESNLQLPERLSSILADDGTQWHFIPPYSPNFGGLWEAGVKSVKFHLKRILTANLTFEELSTTLCEIEACLNSRPLIPVDTTDPDVEVLTPGHFLIGEAPVTIPNPDLREINTNRLSRWQFTQKLVRDFWHKWQNEYLSRLQERPKWLKREREFELGDIVLIKDDQLPPGKWSLGRVLDKHPGPDGVTRVYSVRCRGDVTKRSVSKLCELPVNTNEQ
ncbi:uncharacterized protein LOC133515953 [Cydia pomonella]|uniref:uncharacterized protein LOC133515953 n=1 Tax=Cydia pomonella TaxID=82600 RepID=UPI002ADE73F5|nr:uncharacterized protein LOC133515953 [Cydia pomonella]